METKKQMKTQENWVNVAIEQLKLALESPEFTGKTERVKYGVMGKENEREIILSYGKLNIITTLSEDEYKIFKEKERLIWA